MTSPKISIIIPVYRAESTIRKCLDSILSQTFTEWEAILVDDGSPDNSGMICGEYAKKDSRFRVIHKKNEGVSAARQTGLEAVNGDYVIHVDPDDWIENNMLEDLYNKSVEDDCDMLICDFYSEIDGVTFYKEQHPTGLNSREVLNDLLYGSLHGSCCNKLVKCDSYKSKDVNFPKDVNYREDMCFCIKLLKQNIKISYINNAYYHYVQYSNSITNSFDIKKLENAKMYVKFMETQFPSTSHAVIVAKEWVKRETFRFSILSRNEFSCLYPEIKKPLGQKFPVNLMFYFAFNGYYKIAEFMLKIYTYMQR